MGACITNTYDEGAVSEICEKYVRQIDALGVGILCTFLSSVGQQQNVLHYERAYDKQDASLKLMPSPLDMPMPDRIC